MFITILILIFVAAIVAVLWMVNRAPMITSNGTLIPDRLVRLRGCHDNARHSWGKSGQGFMCHVCGEYAQATEEELSNRIWIG